MIADPSYPTLEEFEAVFQRHHSATLALEEWCKLRGMGGTIKITAEKTDAKSPVDAEIIRQRLALTENDSVLLRNVKLRCDSSVLSLAWNWYVPSRIPSQMNDVLRQTNEPFGKVVASLKFQRQSLSSTTDTDDDTPTGTIATHHALLILPNGLPLAYVVECYSRENLTPFR